MALKFSHIATLIAAVLLIAQTPIHAAPSQQPPPAKGQAVSPDKSDNRAGTQQRGTGQMPLVVEAHVSGKLQTTADNTGQETKTEKSPWLEPITFFTFLLVLVGGGQVWFLRNTDISTTRAANAAKQAADAAMAGQRAFIDIQPYWSQETVEGDFVFGAKWINAGNSHATNIRQFIDYCFVDSDTDLPDDFVFPDNVPPIATASGNMLGPKREFFSPNVPRDGVITAAQMADIKAKKKRLYFFGWAKYSDIFPGSEEHITKFCYFVRVIDNPKLPVVFSSHHRYNCADEGCC